LAAGYSKVAGVDEAGRGPLAGPVVAGAVILPRDFQHRVLNDSKLLTPAVREELYRELTGNPPVTWAVGSASVEEIDRFNILAATWQAMYRALAALAVQPDHVLIDGLPVPPIKIPQTAIVGGDGRSFSIAAASVLAKVTRDRWMTELHQQFPQYNFAQHKGYGTPEHCAALDKFGPCPIHRKTFAPVIHALGLVQTELPGAGSAS
jgi:ribonuclease HII